MTELLSSLRRLGAYTPLKMSVLGALSCAIFGVDTQKAYFIPPLFEDTKKRFFIITPDEKQARQTAEFLQSELGKTLLFPVKDYNFRDVESSSRFDENRRMDIYTRLKNKDYRALVIPAEALCALTLAPDDIRETVIYADSAPGFDNVRRTLAEYGYTSATQVEGQGQFSVRGGIIDVYPPSEDTPFRLEFFGDDLDSLYRFDPNTQRRTERADLVRLIPAAEISTTYADRLGLWLREHDENDAARKDFSLLESGILPRHDRYLPLLCDRHGSVLDYADEDVCTVLFDHKACLEAVQGFYDRLSEDIRTAVEDGLCFVNKSYAHDADDVLRRIQKPVLFDTFLCTVSEFRLDHLCEVQMFPSSITGTDALAEEISRYLCEGYNVDVLCSGNAHAQEVREALGAKPSLHVSVGSLPYGFVLPETKRAVYSFRQKTLTARPERRTKYRRGDAIKRFSDISKGDFVVHENYGIAVYDGIHKVESLGVVNDYIKLRFAGTDVLYIPCSQLELISKYTGGEDGAHVKLNKLGGTDWEHTKQKVRKGVKDLAKELISLYGKRLKVQGFAFSPDTEWQRDFEAGFPFEETDDQLKSIYEIKEDMEKPVPMDRLLCGDVGFGKTEVALRAVFKAVMDGKQVALLAPTTLLALQHFNTMQERFVGFPIRVGLLSRMRTPSQQKTTLKKLKDGTLDVLVGTHRILQKDVVFKDLGLIIIDEEQRFGVGHKEHLKELSSNADVLTLSATPIPRTLNMSMSGIRDISILNDPPQNRHPVTTYVAEYDLGIVTDAIKREVARGGQVFYLHNHIDSIYKTAQTLYDKTGLNVQVAHGKMSQEEISDIWDALLKKQIDVLVCTTIIETGVDVPNCNTLIIEDADRLGLAQLHQIRGRVGRSDRRAYAYFLFRRGKTLSEDAYKRLMTIREYTEFGSGLKIAMRDLEIRGAGNVLGAEQSGHMMTVGYDMYMKLLSEAVSEEQGTEKPQTSCTVDIKVSAYIPDTFIRDTETRIEVYKLIASICDEASHDDVLDEIIDRFGDPPAPLLTLLAIARIKALASACGIEKVSQAQNGIEFIFTSSPSLDAVSAVSKQYPRRLFFTPMPKPYFTFKTSDTLKETEDFLKNLTIALASDTKV